jgi:hypothetical protein
MPWTVRGFERAEGGQVEIDARSIVCSIVTFHTLPFIITASPHYQEPSKLHTSSNSVVVQRRLPTIEQTQYRRGRCFKFVGFRI